MVKVVAGSTVAATEYGATSRLVKVDANGRLEVTTNAAAPVDVNVLQIATRPAAVSLPNAGAAETNMPVGGTTAHDDAVGQEYPVLGGAMATAAEPVAVADGDMARFTATLGGRLRVDTVGVVDEVLALRADGDLVNLLLDTSGRLHVRPAGYDSLTDTVKGTVNTTADDRDEAAQVIADETNAAAVTTNFPSDNGIEIGNRSFLSWIMRLNDVTSVAFEVSNDRVIWADGTGGPVLVAAGDGLNGHIATDFTSAAGVDTDFALDWERCGYRYIRFAVTPPNATNEFSISMMQRAL